MPYFPIVTYANGMWKHTATATQGWTLTSTTYGDPAAISNGSTGVAFAAIGTPIGFSSVVSQKSGSDFLPGIVITPSVSGTFKVVANVTALTAASAGVSNWQITDGTTVWDRSEHRAGAGSSANSYSSQVLEAILPITTSGTTVKIQMAADTGAAQINSNTGLANLITWSVIRVGN